MSTTAAACVKIAAACMKIAAAILENCRCDHFACVWLPQTAADCRCKEICFVFLTTSTLDFQRYSFSIVGSIDLSILLHTQFI
jgi:hypothetical protein